MNGCEPNEVMLATLAPGACFELILTRTTSILGVVLEHGPGSTVVNTDTGKREHWCSECPVKSHPDKDPRSWLKIKHEDGDDMEGEKKVRKAKARKPKEPKKLLVVRYTATDKKAEHLTDESKKTYAALAYRAIKASPGCTFGDVWSAIYRNVTGATEGKTPKNSIRSLISILIKNNFVKSSEKREEVKESAKSAAA